MKNYFIYGFQVNVSHGWYKTLIVFEDIKVCMSF